MGRFFTAVLAVLMAGFFATGCGSKVSEDKPIATVKTEAQAMSVSQLQGMVENYKKVISVKQTEIQALQEKIKAIPITQLLGEEAKTLKDDISKIAVSVKALTDRMAIYAQELKVKQTK